MKKVWLLSVYNNLITNLVLSPSIFITYLADLYNLKYLPFLHLFLKK